MAKSEGVRRIMLTGKLIILIGITLGVMAYVVLVSFPQLLTSGILIGAPIAIYVAALGGLVWAAGWIVQGFSQPDP